MVRKFAHWEPSQLGRVEPPVHDPMRADSPDPLARRLARLIRWERARSLTLAAVGLATAITVLAGDAPSVIESLGAMGLILDQAPDAEPDRTTSAANMCGRRWYWDDALPTPVVENHGERWFAYDFLGTSKIEIEVEADPDGARTRLRAWVRSICDSQPRRMHVWGFNQDTVRSELVQLIESECPTLEIPDCSAVPVF